MAGVFASGDYFEVFIRYVNLKTASGIEIVKVFDESTEKGKQDIEKYGEKVQKIGRAHV